MFRVKQCEAELGNVGFPISLQYFYLYDIYFFQPETAFASLKLYTETATLSPISILDTDT